MAAGRLGKRSQPLGSGAHEPRPLHTTTTVPRLPPVMALMPKSRMSLLPPQSPGLRRCIPCPASIEHPW